MTEQMVENYFGVCPTCGASPDYYNVGRDHFAACDEHRLVWHLGSNLFDSWRHESQHDWDANQKRLSDYRLVPLEDVPSDFAG